MGEKTQTINSQSRSVIWKICDAGWSFTRNIRKNELSSFMCLLPSSPVVVIVFSRAEGGREEETSREMRSDESTRRRSSECA